MMDSTNDVRLEWAQISAYELAQRRGALIASTGNSKVPFHTGGIAEATIAQWYAAQADKHVAGRRMLSAGAHIPGTAPLADVVIDDDEREAGNAFAADVV